MKDKAHKEIYGIIYKITNIVNGKVYIGQTKRTFNQRYSCKGVGIERIYNYHKQRKRDIGSCNSHLLKSIEKYGFKSFEIDCNLDTAYSKDELNEKEIYWINYYDSTNNKYGYNKREGGDGEWVASVKEDNLSKCSKPVYCYETSQIFKSSAEADRFFNMRIGCVGSECNRDTGIFLNSEFGYFSFSKVEDLKRGVNPMYCIEHDLYIYLVMKKLMIFMEWTKLNSSDLLVQIMNL